MKSIFNIVYLQLNKFGKLDKEESLIYEYCLIHKLTVKFYALKNVLRGNLRLTRNDLVVGEIKSIYSALKYLNVPIPVVDDYPECLTKFLNRKIKIMRAMNITAFPAFIKPAKRLKKFNGFVALDKQDLHGYNHISGNEICYVSEVVEFKSEWRIFVCKKQILGILSAPGCENDNVNHLDLDVISEAINVFNDKHGYAIDFGITNDNKTVLIEVNDGFSIGAYGLDSKNYFNVLAARWKQLVSN